MCKTNRDDAAEATRTATHNVHISDRKVKVFASEVEESTLKQARELARMPFVWPHVALMPDAHTGLGSSVGTVFGTKRAVIPAAVGVDIGCGMIGVLTQFTKDDLQGKDLKDLRQAIEDNIPLSPGNYNSWQLRDSANDRCRELNALAELCLDEQDRVWMFLHSGSRGVGNKIAKKHIKIAQRLCEQWWIPLPNKDLAYLVQGTPEFKAYLQDLKWAQRFAFLNREEMMDRFADCLEEFMGQELVELERINCHHNYTVKEKHFGHEVWLTRKGAVNAAEGRKALIPGSMGTASYVVEGKGYPGGLMSAPHGAGRRFSRTEARRRFTVDDLAARMEGIEYRPGEEFIDEIPDAYKDIDVVMRDAEPLVTVLHRLRQVMNVKGT